MATTVTDSTGLRSGNPALNESFVEKNLRLAAPRPMTVVGVSFKTLVLLAVLVAGGAWGGASAVQPTGSTSGAVTPTRP
jgi:hypothetical protein